VSKAHDPLEARTLVCLQGGCADWRWPDVIQVIERTCERHLRRKGKCTRRCEVSYALTSLAAEEVGALGLERVWRGDWTIEKRKHYVRDVTLGEDRHPMYRGNAPQVLAAIRNRLIELW
jgi:predicted transposase YbfD/YdcC